MPVFSLSAAREASAGGRFSVAASHYLAVLKLRADKRDELRDEFMDAMRRFVETLHLDQVCGKYSLSISK